MTGRPPAPRMTASATFTASSGFLIRPEPSPELPPWAPDSHIDIQNVRPRLLRGDARRLLHAVRVAAEELHRRRVLPLAQLQQGKGFFVLIAQGLGADHLRHGVPRPQLPAHRPEAQVGHSGHGRQSQL